MKTLSFNGRHYQVTCSSTSNRGWLSGQKSDPLPTKIRLLRRGSNPSIKGTFIVDGTTDSVLPQNQRAAGFERVAIDYNHCTVEGSPEYEKGQPKAILGYGTPTMDSDGLVLKDIEWTPLGREHARNYEDLSPALAMDEHGSVTFIHSVALTPNGCLDQSRVGELINNSAGGQLNYAEPSITPERMPSELHVLDWGRQQDTYQRWVQIGQETADKLPENQKAYKLSAVPIVVPAESPGSPAQIGGTGIPKVVPGPGGGLVLSNIQWNDVGRASILHFSCLRPEVLLGEDGMVVGLWSVWLSNGRGIGFHKLPSFLQLNAAKAKQLQPNAAKAKQPLKGYARMEAAFHRDNVARLNQAPKPLLSKDQLVEELFVLHAPMNEAGVAFTRERLAAMDLPTLRILQANTPRKVRGAGAMRFFQERDARQAPDPHRPLSLLHCGEDGRSLIVDRLIRLHQPALDDTGVPYAREQLLSLPLANLQILLCNVPLKFHGRDLLLAATQLEN